MKVAYFFGDTIYFGEPFGFWPAVDWLRKSGLVKQEENNFVSVMILVYRFGQLG